MTTFDPGASVVLTHGLDLRPLRLALRARMPAAIITLGFEVFVHDVIAATATAPWSSVYSVPSCSVTWVGFEAACGAALTCTWCTPWAVSSSCGVKPTGSDAGNVPSTASSTKERFESA